jgi:hypothetical protein
MHWTLSLGSGIIFTGARRRRVLRSVTEAAMPSFALTVNGGSQTVEVRDPNELRACVRT